MEVNQNIQALEFFVSGFILLAATTLELVVLFSQGKFDMKELGPGTVLLLMVTGTTLASLGVALAAIKADISPIFGVIFVVGTIFSGHTIRTRYIWKAKAFD